MKKQNEKKRRLTQQGFSLIEIMIVIAIMGLVMGVIVPNVIGKLEQANVESTKMNMKQLATTLKSYRLDCGSYPTTDQSLEALKAKPTAAPECRNYPPSAYLPAQKPVEDSWNRPFLYESDGNTFTITSQGKDRAPGGADYNSDIIVTDGD